MSRSRVGSLGRRLSTWLALQSLAGLSVVCVAVYAVTHMNFEARQIEALTQKQTQVRHLLTEETQRGDASTLTHKLDDFFVGHQDLALSLVRPDGGVFYQRAVGASSPGSARVVRFEVASMATAPDKLTAVLTLDTGDDRQLLHRLALTLLAAALSGAALVSVGGFVLVRLGLRPVRELVEQTRLLAADTLHRRLDGSGQAEELEPLIAQFNELLGRLSQAYEQLEGFNADVAHELCTPLRHPDQQHRTGAAQGSRCRRTARGARVEPGRTAARGWHRAGHALSLAGRSWQFGAARGDGQPGRGGPAGG